MDADDPNVCSDERALEAKGAPRRSQVAGVALMLACTTSFTAMAAISKLMGARASTFEKLFWRSAVSATCILLSKLWFGGIDAGSFWPRNRKLVLLRGLCGHLSYVAYLESLELLPLAIAVLLSKIYPLTAAIFGWIFLGEPLHRTRIAAILVSLGGVALVARPDPGDMLHSSAIGVLVALGGGVVTGAALCCVCALGRAGESELWLLLSMPSVSLLSTAPWAVAAGLRAPPRGWEVWCGFLALGLVDLAAQIFLARGLRHLSMASGSQAMNYGTIVAVFIGIAIGDPWPTWHFWVGGAIIIAALHGADAAERRADAAVEAGLPEHFLKRGCSQELAETGNACQACES